MPEGVHLVGAHREQSFLKVLSIGLMKMRDYLVRVVTVEGHIRGLACVSTQLVREICRRHGTSPTASAALGRALTGGALFGALLKWQQRVAIKFEGNGPLKKILVEADSDGTVRGYVGEPQVHLDLKDGKLDVAGALGPSGLLTVAKDLRLKEPYRGIVQLYTSEIAEDLAYYLTESEQIPSAVGLGVFVEPDGIVSAAGGFLVQSLPPSSDEMIRQVALHLEGLPSITELLREGAQPEDLIQLIFKGIPYDVLEKRPLSFQCSCSRERVERALVTLDQEELQSLASERGDLEVNCEYCGEKYIFSTGDVRDLQEKAPPRGKALH